MTTEQYQTDKQVLDHTTFAIWYAENIGDDNKPVREAAWETYRAFSGCTAPQPAPAPLTMGDIWRARDEGYQAGVESSLPRKITAEMRAAFRDAYREGSIWTDRLDRALECMLAAAQKPAAQGGQ